MRPPTAKTMAEAAEALIAGAHDGSILDRGGKPYKPSTARGHEQLLRAYMLPALGGWKLSQIQRRDRQRPTQPGPSASTIANSLDPLRVIFRRAIRGDESSIDPTDNLDLPAIRRAATASSHPSAPTSTSPRSPIQTERSGRSRCSAASAAANYAACSGSTSTSTMV